MLRESMSGLSNTKLIRQCAQLPAEAPSDITTAAVYTLQLLARRILDLTNQINDLKQRITPRILPSRPAARRSINSKPCSWRPIQPCVRRCRA